MKNILSILAGLALVAALALPAAGQQYTLGNLLNGGTQNIKSSGVNATTVTSNYTGQVITLTKYEDVCLQLGFKNLDGSATLPVEFTFARSTDGTNYATLTQDVVSVPQNGTTAVVVTTNWNVGSVGYLKLVSIANTETNELYHVTNLVVRYSIKPKRFGN